MAGEVYSIKLRFDVDDSQLSKAERRLGNLNNRQIRPRITGGSGRIGGGGNVNEDSSYLQRLFVRMGGDPHGVRKGFNIVGSQFSRFNAGFMGNLLSTTGFLTNASNLGRAVGSLGTLMGKAFPIIGGALSALQLGLKAATYITGYRILRGVVPVMVSNKLLNNESLGTAASNLMQFRTAQIGLGSEYANAMKQATGIAAEYGYSRAGVIGAINMFRGLNVGGKPLSTAQASRMATIIGKISHSGGVSYEKVNRNLQQLLGQAVPIVRDINELVTDAPLIGKLAQQSMFRDTGRVGDIRQYLKDKSKLLEVLAEFDKQVESNPYLQARGKAAMAKENFFMAIVEGNTESWAKMAEGVSRFFQNMIPIAGMAIEAISNLTNSINIDTATTVITKWGSKILKFFGLSDNIIGMIAGIDPETGTAIRKDFNPVTGEFTETKIPSSEYSTLESLFRHNIEAEEQYNKYKKSLAPTRTEFQDIIGRPVSDEEYKSFLDSFLLSPEKYITATKGKQIINLKEPGNFMQRARWEAVKEWKPLGLHEDGFPLYTGQYRNQLGELVTVHRPAGNIITPFSSRLNIDAIQKYFNAANDSLAGIGTDTGTSQDLENISKGARALIINFNKEIVSMPINIDKVNDGTDIANRIMMLVREEVVTGLNIALNNATTAGF